MAANNSSSSNQRQRSQQHRDSLEKAHTLQSTKVAAIRKAWVIETDPSRKFQYEQQLQEEESILKELEEKLNAIEGQGEFRDDSNFDNEVMNNQQSQKRINMNYDISKIQQLIKKALNADDIVDLCFNYFRKVHDNFTDGQTLNPRIRLLIQYAETHQEIPKLLKAIQEYNPTAYQEFASDLGYIEESKNEFVQNKNINIESNHTANSPINKCDILVLSANPMGTDPLQLEQEARLIQQRLQEGEVGQKYIVNVQRAVTVEDLSKYLLQYEPLIVHFSGHGSPSGEIILNNAQGQSQLVSPTALAELLALVRGRIECVVLNACFSLEKADALSEQVRCIVGMNAEIDDESAISFSAGFYRALGFGRGYYTAFELGRNQIQLLNLPDSFIPHFVSRDTSILEDEMGKPRVTRTAPPKLPTATQYPLWFGTNRKPNDPEDASKGFSGERDRQLHYGTCQVAVPHSHKIGSTGSSLLQRWLSGKDDRLKLKQDTLKLVDEAVFLAYIQQTLQEQKLNESCALVFIHGFNVSFEDAALRAAQIGFDLQVPGIMAFYSWPSKGKLTGYTADEATIEASEKYIAEFLLNLTQNSGINKIHVIAHSMGNRGLLRAMQRVLAKVESESKIPFGQIFLAAPDVDPDLFQELAQAYQKLAERTTLYVSSKDKALATSGIIHSHPRVGFFPPITVVEGIDTVEVSNIDLTLLGHGYYADARNLLQDIHQLLINNIPPEKRFGLKVMQIGIQKYWTIEK